MFLADLSPSGMQSRRMEMGGSVRQILLCSKELFSSVSDVWLLGQVKNFWLLGLLREFSTELGSLLWGGRDQRGLVRLCNATTGRTGTTCSLSAWGSQVFQHWILWGVGPTVLAELPRFCLRYKRESSLHLICLVKHHSYFRLNCFIPKELRHCDRKVHCLSCYHINSGISWSLSFCFCFKHRLTWASRQFNHDEIIAPCLAANKPCWARAARKNARHSVNL